MSVRNAALPYGPQSAAIRAFLVQFAGLSATDRARVADSHAQLASTRGWMSAERQLGETMARSDRESFRDALSGPLLQLVRLAGTNEPATEEEALASLDPVAEAALAAVLALLLQDLLPPEVVRTLCAPFDGVLTILPADRAS